MKTQITFVMQDEIATTVDYLVDEVVETQADIVRTMDYLVDEVSELHAILHEEPDLYIEPLTAREEYEEEIRECIEWKEERPVYWKMMFKNGIDIQTFAFTLLPEETRKRLLN